MATIGSRGFDYPITSFSSQSLTAKRTVLPGQYYGKPRPLKYLKKTPDQQNGEVRIIKRKHSEEQNGV